MARPVPVLPEVGSMIVPPGRSRPSRSAASTMRSATRSLIDPPGLKTSILATSRQRRSGSRRLRRTIGVSPIVSRMESRISVSLPATVAMAPTIPPGARLSAMTDFPDLSLDASSAFVRGSGLVVDALSGTEVLGHIDAGPDHHTPWGVVHGGLYATAIESACSAGASAAVMDAGQYAVGLSNTTDFIRAHRDGRLDVCAVPVHQGRTGQLWRCDITREDGKLVAQGRVRLQNVGG